MIQSKPSLETNFVPDLTALLDLLFIVMVFLLLSTNIAIKTMDITIPHTEDSEVLTTKEKSIITINILATQPNWALEGTVYSDWTLFTQDLLLAVKNSPDKSLVIAADKNASVETMLKLLTFLQNNQINTTNIMMDDSKS